MNIYVIEFIIFMAAYNTYVVHLYSKNQEIKNDLKLVQKENERLRNVIKNNCKFECESKEEAQKQNMRIF